MPIPPASHYISCPLHQLPITAVSTLPCLNACLVFSIESYYIFNFESNSRRFRQRDGPRKGPTPLQAHYETSRSPVDSSTRQQCHCTGLLFMMAASELRSQQPRHRQQRHLYREHVCQVDGG